MLRLVVVLLLLANIGYFAWAGWVAPTPVSAAPTPAPVAPRLAFATEVEASSPPAVAEAPEAGLRCVSIGPFFDVTDVARASMSLRALGLPPRQRAAEGPVWAGFWVALDNIATRVEADGIVAKLRQFGMADAYVVEGPDPVTISLGLFSEQQRALRRLDEVKAQGLAPVIVSRERTGTVYWIDVDHDPAAVPIDTSQLQGEAGRILRLRIEPCGPEATLSEPVPEAGAPPGVPG